MSIQAQPQKSDHRGTINNVGAPKRHDQVFRLGIGADVIVRHVRNEVREGIRAGSL